MLYVVEESRFRLVAECGCAPEVVEKVREILLDSEHGRRLLSEQWLEGTDDYRTTMPDVASIQSSHRRALSAWSIPLVIEAKVVGVLAMGFYEARQFREDEREFARLFAQHCAQAVARAERSARLDRERLRLARIFDTNLISFTPSKTGPRDSRRRP